MILRNLFLCSKFLQRLTYHLYSYSTLKIQKGKLCDLYQLFLGLTCIGCWLPVLIGTAVFPALVSVCKSVSRSTHWALIPTRSCTRCACSVTVWTWTRVQIFAILAWIKDESCKQQLTQCVFYKIFRLHDCNYWKTLLFTHRTTMEFCRIKSYVTNRNC